MRAISSSKSISSSFLEKRREQKGSRSSALIITLIVLVLVSLLVVSLAGMVQFERVTTHSSFENERARQFANLAVDEVVATLRDNIPTNNLWAAGPGQLSVFTSQDTYQSIDLFSGSTNGSTTGTIDLNAPVLGGASPTSYPIVPTNNIEYTGVTQMPVAWVDVLQDGTLVRTPTAVDATPANPVVGRYAYWVDTETSKANINTGGGSEVSTFFNILTNNNPFVSTPVQNLTGSPSRLDFSQLDWGGVNMQTLTKATYHYTYGGNYAGDYLTNSGGSAAVMATPSVTANSNLLTTAPLGTVLEGMQRFNSIYEWPQLNRDPFTGGAFAPATSAQVEMNKFYLTTKSRTPEVNPWGYNKLWWQRNAAATAITGMPAAGNVLNAKGIPLYPASVTTPPSYALTAAPLDSIDTRFYCYPFDTSAGIATPDMQWMSPYDASNQSTKDGQFVWYAFIQNMMKLMARRDWPGMPGVSFIDKYGQKECEDLAYDMLCLYDSSLAAKGSLGFNGVNGSLKPDNYGHYGDHLVYYIGTNVYTGLQETPRLLGAVTEAPYINEVAVTFTPTTGGYSSTNFLSNPQTGANGNTNAVLQVNGPATPMWSSTGGYTKDGANPGFAPPIPTNAASFLAQGFTNAAGATTNYMNVAMTPSVRLYYPPGFKDYWTFRNGGNGNTITVGYLDILVTATGTWTDTNGLVHPVTYGGTNSSNGDGTQYYWGYLDDHQPPLAPAPGTANGESFLPLPLSFSSTNSTAILTGSPIYIGPFDAGTSPKVTVQFRTFATASGPSTVAFPYEIAPQGQNYATPPTPSLPPFTVLPGTNPNATLGAMITGMNKTQTEGQAWTNVLFSPSTTNDVTASNPDGSYKTNYVSPTFAFTINAASHPSLALTASGSGSAAECYQVTDPRVYRYLSDWTVSQGGISTSATNFPSYVSSYADPLTGIKGDDSKLAWPIVTSAYYANFSTADPRLAQLANNITGFPGVGWFSVLPLNIESSQGPLSAGGSGDPGVTSPPYKAIPWRTLSLLPATNPNQLPDWLFLDCFAIAYDQTFCSQTDGKVNVNTGVYPFGFNRAAPLAALMCPKTYSAQTASPFAAPYDVSSLSITQARAIANTLATNGTSSSYVVGPCAGLPTNIYTYTGQICQEGALTNPGGGIETQFQMESLARSLAGTITTRSSDFKVHVIAQSVKQVFLEGTSTLVVTGEQRMRALVSRETNVGQDNLPNTADDPQPVPDPAIEEIGRTNPSGVFPAFSDPTKGNGAWRPPFKFVISDIEYINN